jgi:N-methylhydantoinase B
MSPSQRIDPITLSVLWSRLLSITEEMGSTLRRTAFSEAVREGDDFSTGLFDRRGRLVAQGNFSPGHMGSMPFVVQSVLEDFPPGSLRPGDAVALNDSFLGSGHFPDFFLVSPVFADDAVIGYMVNTAHHVDVGGAQPGSQEVAGVTDAIQEGIRVLPVRLFKDGAFDADVLRLILANVRLPEKVEGDFKAQRNANHVGAERLAGLFREYGAPLMERAVDEILERTEAGMRQRFAALADGAYEFEDWIDDAGPGSDPIRCHLRLSIVGDEIELDFSESSDQVAAGINSYINYTRAYSAFAVKVLTQAHVPQNAGAIRPITVTARPGSYFNPRYPAPSGGRAAIQVRIFEVVNGALAQVLPERAMAGFSHWSNPNISGIDDRSGRRYVQYDLVFGGYGGQANKDGVEGLAPVMNCTNIPVEVLEWLNPARVLRFGIIPDSGGAGRFRGGCGVQKDIEILNQRALITLLGDRHKFQPYGLFGGRPGRKGETVLNPDGEARQLGSKETLELSRGDVVSLRLSGGGGYGEAAERDIGRIEDDLADGYVTEAGAGRDYGVEVSAGSVQRGPSQDGPSRR